MNHIVKEFLKERNAEHLYEDFMDLLISYDPLRFKIFRDYERDCHREDVRTELNEMGIRYSDFEAECITDLYEDRLLDLDDWHVVLRECIHEYLMEVNDG
jgi:hypothetical protein